MSEQDRIAFEALNRLIEQDHKVPQGSMTLGIISERLNHRYKTGFIEGYKAATAEANKRIEILLEQQDRLIDRNDELQASDHTLREALHLVNEHSKLWGFKIAGNVQTAINEALSATPAESLQAHDDV